MGSCTINLLRHIVSDIDNRYITDGQLQGGSVATAGALNLISKVKIKIKLKIYENKLNYNISKINYDREINNLIRDNFMSNIFV